MQEVEIMVIGKSKIINSCKFLIVRLLLIMHGNHMSAGES